MLLVLTREAARLLLSLLTKPDPDASLVSAARNGDVRAFDALVYRYQARLGQFVRARLNSAIDSDDVTQEIFVRVRSEKVGRGRESSSSAPSNLSG